MPVTAAMAVTSTARPSQKSQFMTLVDHLALHQVVHALEMRNFQRAHRLDGHGEGLIGTACHVRLRQALSCSPQGAEHLRPIEALTFTVVAEAHTVLPDDRIVPEAVEFCKSWFPPRQ